MNIFTLLKSYLTTILKFDMTEPAPYVFDRECLVLPSHLKQSLPDEITQAFVDARWSASKALRQIRVLEKNYQKRYFAMCPSSNNVQRGVRHIDSVTRLLSWKSDHGCQYNPTLAPTSKIDHTTLFFCIDHRTYDEFARDYVDHLEKFIDNHYRGWLSAQERVNALVANARLNDMVYSHWHRFWNRTFLVEMQKWEGRLQDLVLPSWEEILESLRHLILECVESPHEALRALYSDSNILSQ